MPPRNRSRRSAVFVFIVAMTATLFGVWRERELGRRNQIIRWQDGFAQLQPVLAPLLGQRFEILRDQAKTTLRRGNYTVESWNDFVAASEWRQRFPGMVEIGYADFSGETCRVKFLASQLPAGGHAPDDDLSREPVLQEAVQKCADAGYGLASKEISLGAGPSAVRVVVGLLPLPKQDARPGTAAENRANLHGLVFFALNQAEYFHYCQPQLEHLPMTLRRLAANESAPPRTATQRTIGQSGVSGDWQFVATLKNQPLDAVAPQWIVLTGGTTLSLLLYFLFATQARLRLEAELAREKIVRHEAEMLALNADLERRIAERTAQLSAANADLIRFQAIIEATTDFINIASIDGQVLYMNQGGRRMVGLPPDADIRPFGIKDFTPSWVWERFEREGFQAAYRAGSWTGEVALLHRDGHEIPVSLVGLVIRSEIGQPQFLACVARDISDQRRVTEKLESALAEERELNLLKGNFISMVSHEIRTPLALILSSSEILSRYLNRLAPEKRAAHLRTIDSAVQRMSALMEDVLLFSKAEAGRMEFNPQVMDLNLLCPQLVDEITSATNRRCPIELSLEKISEPARGDEHLLRHVFVNLLVNAVKYSPPETPVKFSVTREGGCAIFIVQDRGLGIPEDDRKRLFTPFYRGKNVATLPGTGLGLVIVKHCVARHGGHIEIASAENLGTTVSVRLPLFSPAHTEFIQRLSPPPRP